MGSAPAASASRRPGTLQPCKLGCAQTSLRHSHCYVRPRPLNRTTRQCVVLAGRPDLTSGSALGRPCTQRRRGTQSRSPPHRRPSRCRRAVHLVIIPGNYSWQCPGSWPICRQGREAAIGWPRQERGGCSPLDAARGIALGTQRRALCSRARGHGSWIVFLSALDMLAGCNPNVQPWCRLPKPTAYPCTLLCCPNSSHRCLHQRNRRRVTHRRVTRRRFCVRGHRRH